MSNVYRDDRETLISPGQFYVGAFPGSAPAPPGSRGACSMLCRRMKPRPSRARAPASGFWYFLRLAILLRASELHRPQRPWRSGSISARQSGHHQRSICWPLSKRLCCSRGKQFTVWAPGKTMGGKLHFAEYGRTRRKRRLLLCKLLNIHTLFYSAARPMGSGAPG